MAKEDSCILITPEFRMSYPNLVTPRAYQDKGEEKYSVEMIFDPENLGAFKTDDGNGQFADASVASVAAKVAKGKWGEDYNVKDAVASGQLGWPVKSGDAKADKREANGKDSEHYRGHKIVSAKASKEYPPRLYVRKESGKWGPLVRGLDSEESQASSLYTGGNYAFAEINAKAIETPQGRFVTVYLNSIKFTREGERLGGSSMMDRFDGVQGGMSDHDPTDGMDDDHIEV